MKTIKELLRIQDQARNQLQQALNISEMARAKSLRKELAFYKTFILYLEINPRKEYLDQQLEAVLKRLQLLEDRFYAWRAGKPRGMAELKAKYRAEVGIPTLKQQIKTLKFLVE